MQFALLVVTIVFEVVGALRGVIVALELTGVAELSGWERSGLERALLLAVKAKFRAIFVIILSRLKARLFMIILYIMMRLPLFVHIYY